MLTDYHSQQNDGNHRSTERTGSCCMFHRIANNENAFASSHLLACDCHNVRHQLRVVARNVEQRYHISANAHRVNAC